ncbi:hint module domain-containing protein [Ditylenchus destructor]|nr:hint module domain-containing protein [Ditylenchus destructor]
MKATFFTLCILFIVIIKKCFSNTAFVPCANVPGQVPVYFDPSVFEPGNSVNITPPTSRCPTCKNAFYFADTMEPALFNGATFTEGVSKLFTPAPDNGLSIITTCPNWCLCRADGVCVLPKSGQSSAGVYPLCTAPNDCAAYFFAVPQGTTSATITTTDPAAPIETVNPILPGMPFSFAPVNTALTSRITTVSCNGCNFPIDCADTTSPAACFSADARLRLIDGNTKRMDELELNDWVLAANKSQMVYSNVISWFHRIHDEKALFLHILLENGKTLKLTSKHFIYRNKCNGWQPVPFETITKDRPIYAEDLRVGDCLYHLAIKGKELVFVERRIVNVSAVEEIGIYAPLTGEGNIVVNDILASCYTIIDSNVLQTDFFKIIQRWPLISWLLGVFETHGQSKVNLPFGLKYLVNYLSQLMPDNLIYRSEL